MKRFILTAVISFAAGAAFGGIGNVLYERLVRSSSIVIINGTEKTAEHLKLSWPGGNTLIGKIESHASKGVRFEAKTDGTLFLEVNGQENQLDVYMTTLGEDYMVLLTSDGPCLITQE